jgi:predicted metalloenzyme YecM
MDTNERRKTIQQPKMPTTVPDFPEDGPEDMELTIPHKPVETINAANNIFDKDAKTVFRGIDTKTSVFEKSALFRTD